jgi:tRNA-specific 2-thiouridylase
VIGTDNELMEDELVASTLNWISLDTLHSPIAVQAKIRYNHIPVPATVYPCGIDKVRVVFHEPQRAITPGQAVVFYDNDTVVGGGWIERKSGKTF